MLRNTRRRCQARGGAAERVTRLPTHALSGRVRLAEDKLDLGGLLIGRCYGNAAVNIKGRDGVS